MAPVGAAPSLSGEISSFLDYCRVEKGLASNTLEAYGRDLKALSGFRKTAIGLPDLEELRRYLDSLYKAGLGSRSIARHKVRLPSDAGTPGASNAPKIRLILVCVSHTSLTSMPSFFKVLRSVAGIC